MQSSVTQSYSFSLSDLGSDTRLVGMAVRSGSLIDQIAFIAASTTVPFHVFGPYGGSGGGSGVTFATGINGFYGRSGHGIDQIGLIGELSEK